MRKTLFSAWLLFLLFGVASAQEDSTAKRINAVKENYSTKDSAREGRNMYGDLLNDDWKYNKIYPAWKPALEVIGINDATWALDRYLMNADYARIDKETWKNNIT